MYSSRSIMDDDEDHDTDDIARVESDDKYIFLISMTKIMIWNVEDQGIQSTSNSVIGIFFVMVIFNCQNNLAW